MTENQFEKGAASAFLHFVFGAVVGAVVFGFVAWLLFPPLGLHATAAGMVLLGIPAAIWRGRFWNALSKNPVFRFWRRLTGSS